MNTEKAYNSWAQQYDTNENKTRDLEAISLRETLNDFHFNHILEIGCGTGKNTEFLLTKAQQITAVDLSDEMLAKAKEKINSEKVDFIKKDITETWDFGRTDYDLVTFSLVLEHFENLHKIFEKLNQVTSDKAFVYIGELHPFKQYSGSKARFETDEGLQIVDCFTHHLSDFTNAANNHDFEILKINEYFDENNREEIPRILTLVFKKK